MESFFLMNGKKVIAQEIEIKGMAGEPMTILQFTNENGEIVNAQEVEPHLSLFDSKVIEEWVRELSECNYCSSVANCI